MPGKPDREGTLFICTILFASVIFLLLVYIFLINHKFRKFISNLHSVSGTSFYYFGTPPTVPPPTYQQQPT